MVDNYLVTIDLLTSQIESKEKEIKEIGDSDEIIQYLMTIDGIGYFTGLAIRAFVGEMERFKGPKSFAAYTGLIPGYRQSAEKIRNTSITKQGVKTLRWVLIQAVPHAIRRSDYLKRMYYRICLRSSVGKAKVAVAHALSRMIYHVWMEGRPYYR